MYAGLYSDLLAALDLEPCIFSAKKGSANWMCSTTTTYTLRRHTSAHEGIHEREQVQHTLTQMPRCTHADTLQPFYLRAQPQACSSYLFSFVWV